MIPTLPTLALAIALAEAPAVGAPAVAAPAAATRALTLAEATDIALGADPGVARARVGEQRARLLSLRAQLERVHVSVDASVQEIYDRRLFGPAPPEGVKAPPSDALLGLGSVEGRVDVPIFTGFRVTSDIARADLLERAAGLDVTSERRRVAVAVAEAYWSARRLALLEETQRASNERLTESERVVQARVKAGLAAGLDTNRAASRRAQIDVERASLISQRREADVRFASVLGIDDAVVLVDPPPAADAALDDADALVQRALDARPELKAAELRGLAVDEERRAAESAYWPQLGAGVLAQTGNNPSIPGAGNRAVSSVAIPFADIAGDVQAGVSVSMNLFDTWATEHNVEDAGHRRRLADEDLRALRRAVESDARLAHAKVASLREQRAALAHAREIVADNVRILQGAYERGDVLLTEVLDEQTRLADAERQIVDVDAQQALARVELDLATNAHANGARP